MLVEKDPVKLKTEEMAIRPILSQDDMESETIDLTEDNQAQQENELQVDRLCQFLIQKMKNKDTVNLRPRGNIRRPARYEENLGGQVMLSFKECTTGVDKEKWNFAIEKEKESLKKNNTWEIVDATQVVGKDILTARWVFKIKDDSTYKARLVVRWCEQREGYLDFKDTFSPVVESASLLTVLFLLAAQENFFMQTFDLKTAFLYGELETEKYMRIPEGYDEEGKVCRLKKALYGLKLAPSQRNKKQTSFLKDENLI